MIQRPTRARTDRSVTTYLIIAVPRKRRIGLILSSATLALCLMAAAGCGKQGGDYGAPPPDYKRALAGAPKPRAALYAQSIRLLPGGADAFGARLAKLRGYPIVVNQWASWCAPCREEFPLFQQATVKLGKRVAFLGVDSQDSNDAASTFLGEYPLAYPSYTDPDQQIGKLLKATLGLPDTAFFDAKGRLVYTKQGAYSSQSELNA